MEINSLVDDCIKSAIDYGVSAFEVVKNARKTNRLYDKDYNNFKKLKSFGEKGILELEKLLEHPNDYVKYGAAAHLLSANEEKARAVLQELANRPKPIGLFGFDVEMLLKEWDKGNLREYLS